MKTSLEIAFQYIKYYKNKSLSIIFSIILSVTLIVGIGTMYNSAKHAKVDQVRKETADYHFMLNLNQKQYSILQNNSNIQKIAVAKYYDSAEDPDLINLISADEDYVKMFNSSIIEGRMPEREGEIAVEEWVLKNLNVNPVIGETVTFNLVKNKKISTFTLVGILKDMPMKKTEGKKEGIILLKKNAKSFKVYFKINEKVNILKELNRITEKLQYDKKAVYQNPELVDALDYLTHTPYEFNQSIRYIINHYNLDLLAIIFVISLFSAFVIYSVYHISALQRISEFGLLKALGTDNQKIFFVMLFELIFLFLIGFPIGFAAGFLCAKLLNSTFSSVFLGQEVKSGQIYISIKAVLAGVLFLMSLLCLITIKMHTKLNKFTPIEAIQKNYKQKVNMPKSNKLYTLRRGRITNYISYKYIIRKKSTFFGILLSLALGGILFICSDYAAGLKRENNDLSVKVNNDLNSDYQVNMEYTDFDKGITDDEIARLNEIDGVQSVSSINYYYGAIVMDDDRMISKRLFRSYNKDPYYINSFGGMYTKIDGEKNKYLLRTGIYGYDDHMLDVLKDYILEGDIDPGKMKQDNLILFKQIQDGGTGLYDMIDIKPGDKVTIKFQKDPEIMKEALRFEAGPEYVEKDFTVGATLKRVAASNEYFLADSGEDIIMTNDQFKKEFGVGTYNMVSITKKDNANHVIVADKIQDVVNNIQKCSFRDLTTEIEENNAYLNKQVIFIYGVTMILLIISLFNILNNIGYNVLSRINEFGVLRATGITDEGFWKMIIREGILYGVFASILTIIGSFLGQIVVLFIVKIGYAYIDPHFTINPQKYLIVILLNILIAVIATIFPSRKIIKMSIVEEVKRSE